MDIFCFAGPNGSGKSTITKKWDTSGVLDKAVALDMNQPASGTEVINNAPKV